MSTPSRIIYPLRPGRPKGIRLRFRDNRPLVLPPFPRASMPSTTETEIKKTGAHYTPEPLAHFAARRLVEHAELNSDSVQLLDPACGDGALLDAVVRQDCSRLLDSMHIVAIDTNERAVTTTRQRLENLDGPSSTVRNADFLEQVVGQSPPCADLIIANPPYVRTQILGAERAGELADTFGLKGRLDLYQAFVVAMTTALNEGGTMAVITSNKLLTTKGAGAVREFLLDRLEILELIDLGDTRLFDAAVLPAVLVAKKTSTALDRNTTTLLSGTFRRAYQTDEPPGENTSEIDSRYDLISVEQPGTYHIGDDTFTVVDGNLRIPKHTGDPWAILTLEETRWLKQIDQRAVTPLGELCDVRVGIKTNADEIFIRQDWKSLPPSRRPEPQLLHPLITQHSASRWIPDQPRRKMPKVLYPHRDADGDRQPVELDAFPNARRYLESHAPRLKQRRYLLDAGRKWFEHWVPQQPSLWSAPKIVFPDISAEMTAFYDDQSIVKGSCYWLCPPHDVLFQILGLLNSRTIARYHDLAFQNRLYAGRRRYLTQYVKNYPVPPLNTTPMQRVERIVRQLVHDDPADHEIPKMEDAVDDAIREAFGLSEPS